jgi:single stranded DNA-binding protein
MDYQKIILVGNATDAAKVQQPEGKSAFMDFTVAVNRSREETDFFPVRYFGTLAEGTIQIKKGAKVLVEGRVEISRFSPKEDEAHRTIRVVASHVIVLEPRVG